MSSQREFIVYTGPMMSGKTSNLLARLDRYRYQKKTIALFKPQLDERYSKNSVVTHSGLSLPATVVETGKDILGELAKLEKQPDVIAVDEAFMLDGIASILVWLWRNSRSSIAVSTLDLSAAGRPFPEVTEMLPWATHVEKCAAVCTVCGADALYTHKKIVNEDEIEIGGAEMYEPRCVNHWAHLQTE